MTAQTLAVLGALLRDPGTARYGLDLGRAAGLRAGTVYPLLARLERAGWLRSEAEQVDERAAGRRARRYYTLTELGVGRARAALDRLGGPGRFVTRDAWAAEVLPNDLGDGEHRWSWLVEASGGPRNLLWGHECAGGRYVLAWIDLASGTRHRLVAEEPLHVEPSILCSACGDHGFVRAGRWVPA